MEYVNSSMVTYNELGIMLILAIVAGTVFFLRVDIKKFL